MHGQKAHKQIGAQLLICVLMIRGELVLRVGYSHNMELDIFYRVLCVMRPGGVWMQNVFSSRLFSAANTNNKAQYS